jgi:hypothetical protein
VGSNVFFLFFFSSLSVSISFFHIFLLNIFFCVFVSFSVCLRLCLCHCLACVARVIVSLVLLFKSSSFFG